MIAIVLVAAFANSAMAKKKNVTPLKETLGKYFTVGVAVNVDQVNGLEPKAVDIITTHFNSVVAENCMKPENLEPAEGKFSFEEADRFIEFAQERNLEIIGHVLVWHDQNAPWMFVNKGGELPNREEMIQRMRTYINTVVGHFKGKVKGWDVINEAILDDGSYRESPWLRAIGPEYFELAFKFAHEADPDAELYYNDFSMSKPGKRATVVKLIKKLKAAGCRIDAIGLQSHNGTDYPDLTEYENSIRAFIDCGVKVQFTELDLNMLPNPEGFGGASITQNFEFQEKYNPYAKGLTKEAQQLFNERYLAFFALYNKYRDHVRRVTLWGVCDHNSWMNNWPIPGRTNYPLLFDRKYQPKPVINDINKIFSE
ncbi:MAG: endo-1,4-beta-xylanase [Prevotella sp.]|nr:endo-1,4-beta-xylanase [Prevotella sp.]